MFTTHWPRRKRSIYVFTTSCRSVPGLICLFFDMTKDCCNISSQRHLHPFRACLDLAGHVQGCKGDPAGLFMKTFHQQTNERTQSARVYCAGGDLCVKSPSLCLNPTRHKTFLSHRPRRRRSIYLSTTCRLSLWFSSIHARNMLFCPLYHGISVNLSFQRQANDPSMMGKSFLFFNVAPTHQ